MNSTLMNRVEEQESVAIKAWAKDRFIYVELSDFRIISFPADRFKKLKQASIQELEKVELKYNGTGLRWEDLDEDISVKGILEGRFQLPM